MKSLIERLEGDYDWKTPAKTLLDANKGKSQDDFYYRAYLRAVINGKKQQASHLAKKFPAAVKAREDLIDLYGKG